MILIDRLGLDILTDINLHSLQKVIHRRNRETTWPVDENKLSYVEWLVNLNRGKSIIGLFSDRIHSSAWGEICKEWYNDRLIVCF